MASALLNFFWTVTYKTKYYLSRLRFAVKLIGIDFNADWSIEESIVPIGELQP